MYSAELLDHFQNPRNVGEVENPDAMAEIQNPACGDLLRLTMNQVSGHITDVKFKAQGCAASIACGSALTEIMMGRRLDDIRNLRREELISAVGGLPQASTHAAELALDALAVVLSRING
jgi:nitrogen fixation protein NifU and related proteins